MVYPQFYSIFIVLQLVTDNVVRSDAGGFNSTQRVGGLWCYGTVAYTCVIFVINIMVSSYHVLLLILRIKVLVGRSRTLPRQFLTDSLHIALLISKFPRLCCI